MINLTALHKTFNKGQPNEVQAIRGVNLQINAGEYVIIVGSNGSGKSTLLNLISGSILPSSGTVNIAGTDVSRLPDYSRSKWIARVFQNPLSGTAPDLSILDNFRLAALRTQTKGFGIGVNHAFRKQVQDKIALLNMGLENKINQQMGTLSGGQRQALTLLMSVMDDCKILLLDEPSAALDPRSAQIVMQTADQLIKQFNLTAILITHNIKDALNYGNRIIQMAEGRVVTDLDADAKSKLSPTEVLDWF